MALYASNFSVGSNGAPVLAADPGCPNAWNFVSSTGASIVTYANSPTFNSPMSAHFVADGIVGCGLVWDTVGLYRDFYGRFYIYPTAFTGIPVGLGRIMVPVASGSQQCSISIDSTGVLNGNDGTFTGTNPAMAALTANQWSRVEFRFVMSSTVGRIQLRQFTGSNVNGTTPSDSSDSGAVVNTTNLSCEQFNVAYWDSPTAVSYFAGIVVGATNWIGPSASLGSDNQFAPLGRGATW